MPPSPKARNLQKVLDLMDVTIALVRRALLDNPSDSERRSLEQQLLRLKSERAVQQEEFDAELAGGTDVQGPTPAQLKRISALSDDVEKATRVTIVASDAIGLASKVFALATAIINLAPIRSAVFRVRD